MQFINKKTIVVFTILIILGSMTMSYAAASVEWDVEKTLQLKSEPIDVAVSPDGRRIFVLNDLGQILIYSSACSFFTSKCQRFCVISRTVNLSSSLPARIFLYRAIARCLAMLSTMV